MVHLLNVLPVEMLCVREPAVFAVVQSVVAPVVPVVSEPGLVSLKK